MLGGSFFLDLREKDWKPILSTKERQYAFHVIAQTGAPGN